MPSPREFFVFCGLIAAGKSVLAEAWARRRGAAYFNSDRVRKELAGVMPPSARREGWRQGIYNRQGTRRTYDTLLERAEAELGRGGSVVLDASYQARAERDRVRVLARRFGVRVVFILCTCPEEEVRQRLAKRRREPLAVSDGRWEIYCRQKMVFEPPLELAGRALITLETTAPVAELLKKLEARLAE